MSHIAQHARAHDGAQLPLEHRNVVQAHADRAIAEERILLGVLGLLFGVFVSPEIERAKHERATIQPLIASA